MDSFKIGPLIEGNDNGTMGRLEAPTLGIGSSQTTEVHLDENG